MRIKTKLSLGVGILFILIVSLSIIGTTQIIRLSNDTKNILVDNYNTLDYSRNMLIALDEDLSEAQNVEQFLANLKKQEGNITEIGEEELTKRLAADFEKLIVHTDSNALRIVLRQDLMDIIHLNMHAIQRKSAVAEKTADRAALWIAVAGTLCFIIAFTLFVNFPGNIANPINELTIKLKEVAQKNYKTRIHLDGSNEFQVLSDTFNLMASKLDEYEGSTFAKLLFEKKRIETLINHIHDPVIGLDENNTIIFANEESLKVTGLKPDQLIGRVAQDVAVNNDLIRYLIRGLVDPQAGTENGKNSPLKIFADNKESFFEREIVEVSLPTSGESQKNHIGHVIVLKNITSFLELNLAKTNFIATVSHELKTPISSIKMSLQLLEDHRIGELNSEQKKLVDHMKDDSERLLKITGELFNLSQVETGNIQLSIQPTQAWDILNYALDTVKIQAEQKMLDFNIMTDSNLPLIKADPEKTAWVLINILTNAIKYSPEKGVVSISLKKAEEKVVFSVKDEGPGIEEKYRDRLFERYFRIPGSGKTGSGLGLSICKEFIEAQGGAIYVAGKLGAGSLFSFELPAAIS